MKIFKFIVPFFVVFLTSCSSSSSSSPSEEIVNDVFNPSFEISVNGEVLTSFNTPKLYKMEDTFNFGYHPSTMLSFNSSGKFGYFDIVIPSSGGVKRFRSFRGFSSNYFNFNIESVDEIKKRVKGSFSGYIYVDPLNLNSEGKYVSGTFYKNYEELVPVVFNVNNKATINGNNWYNTNKYTTRSNDQYFNMTLHYLSDDEYKIMVHYDFQNINIGTYDFSNSDITNKVQLAIFDVNTQSFVNCISNGQLNITYKSGNLIVGTYNFSATNPVTNEIIEVTNGKFKLINDNDI